MTRTLLTAALVGLLLTGCSGPAAAAAAGAGPAPVPSVTTRGVGTVAGVPDTLTVVLGVATRGASAAEALDDADARAAALIETLRARGVADEDLRTSGLSILPTYGDEGRITGYEVDNQVTATVRDTTAAGALIDAAADAAGDAVRVHRIAFSLTDDGEARARARADAVRLARTQAEQLAEAGETALGPILSITEVTAEAPIPFAADAAVAQSVPIAPGTQEITVTVEVVHAIEQ